MIDDKKIEEAASVYGTNNGYSVTGPDGRMSLKPELETAFEAGVHWAISEFLKNLWHDALKEHIPHGKGVIVEYTYKGGLHYRSIRMPDDIQWVRGFSNEKRLRRWVYVDDLFPQEEDE